MVESIYYDYDSSGGSDVDSNRGNNVEIVANNDVLISSDSGTFSSINNEKIINSKNIKTINHEKQKPPITTTKSPPIIYPDPDKIYKSLKEMREDVLFHLREQKHNGDEVETFSTDFSEENFNKDLKGHDLIDNIMYIYYGANNVMRKGLGRNIIVIGAVFGLAAQILAISLSFLRNK